MENYKRDMTVVPVFDGIESLQLNVNGHGAHYLKAGNGPSLVLLHGGASDSRDWVETMNALSHSYSLYAPDILGYGLNTNSKSSYYMYEFVEFTLGFIRELGPDSH
ncbi:MAG: alpha/beta hydrolase, partial [Dehalococcoidia bacterium]|nr:alpha/beta hydrolase [Dehalococcoidia bacterium]